MNTDGSSSITERVIGCAMAVSNTLGCGFLEKVYEAALAHEIRKAGLAVQQQHPVWVLYDGVIVGEYRADLIVNDSVVIEVKAAKALDRIHEAQILNYLRATRLKVGLLFNFGTPRLGIRRLVY